MDRRRSLPAILVTVALLPPFAPPATGGAAPPGLGTGSGLVEFRLADGTVLLSHGYEPRTPEWTDPVPGVAYRGPKMAPGDPERQPVCATDHYQHVLYARVLTDGYEAAKPRIRAAVRRMNAVLNEAAVESGRRSADFKVRCDGSGDIAVDAFQAVGTEFQTIVMSARLAGFDDPDVDYTIFYDALHPLFCGVASFWPDERPTPDNRNNAGGGYAVTYDGCWDGRTPMHENGHNQGAVQASAPASTGSGYHCNDQHDVMCYSDGGNRDRGDYVACADKMHYDCNFDTYFDAAPEPGEWLATQWNIGSPGNRFVVFGPPAHGPRPGPR